MNYFNLLITICLLFLTTALFAQNIEEQIKARLPEILEEHRELVSLPNVALHPPDMQKNAEWLVRAFAKRGLQARLLEAGEIPIVFAERQIDSNLPTVLFYFHYDGQPVDPSEWDQEDPFKPVLKMMSPSGKWKSIPYPITNTHQLDSEAHYDKEWRIFGRAAADDKGPIMMMLTALDILKQNNEALAFNVKILLDGEEEAGSNGLLSTLEKYKSIYAANHLIIMDGPAHPSNEPTITFGCRGIASATLTVYGAKVPQHSGHFGNYAPNAAFRMAQLLATMKDDDGRVLIKGFYDGVNLDTSVKSLLATVPDDLEMINNRLGIAQPEAVGNNYQESLQYPSLNIRGMASAWIGKQTRTIVPEKATAQLGIRLVPETDGDRLLALVRKHIQNQGYYVIDRAPTNEERLQHKKVATFTGSKWVNAFRTEIDSPTGQWLTTALEKTHGKAPVKIRIMGGTVPVTPLIEALGIPAAIVPMVNMDNNQHSPNENLRLGNLIDGIKTCVGILTTKNKK